MLLWLTEMHLKHVIGSNMGNIPFLCLCCVNAFYAVGECRRRVKNVTNFEKNVKIVEFHDHIWKNHEKCIKISTNMPVIVSLIS